MPLCRSPLTLRLALFSRSRTAAVEIPRFILHRRRSEFLPLHRGAEIRTSFASAQPCTGEPRFALSSPQRSLAQGSQEAHFVRLAEDREPRTALNCRGGTLFCVNAVTGRGYNPSVAPKARQLPLHRGAEIRTSFASAQPCTGEPRFALRKATVMRTKILSVTPLNPLGVTAPLMNKGSQEARSVCLTEHRGAKKRAQFALQRTGSRELHSIAAVALPLQDVPRPAAHLNISPKGRNISHAQSAYFTAPQARFHTAAKLPYITAARRDAHSLLQPFGTKKSL